MNSFSMADLRAQGVPPWGCQRCRNVVVSRCQTESGWVTRWTCGDGLHMQAACMGRVPTEFNLPVEPVLAGESK